MNAWRLTYASWFWKLSFIVLMPFTACFRRSAHVVLIVITVATITLLKFDSKTFKSMALTLWRGGHAAMKALYVLIGLLWIWMAVSMCWAPHLITSVLLFTKLSLVLFSFLLLTHTTPLVAQRIPTSFWLTVTLIGVTFLLFENLEGHIMRRMVRFNEQSLLSAPMVLGAEYINSGIVLCLLFWPALTEQLSQKKYGLCCVFTLLVALVLKHVDSDAARLGFMVGLGVFMVSTRLSPRMRLYLMPGLIITTVIIAPFVGSTLSVPKIAHAIESKVYGQRARLIIWEYTCQMIRQKPLKGWGLGATTPASQKFAMPDMYGPLPSVEPAPVLWTAEGRQPLDPHNGFLHVWVELGGLGGLLWGCIIAGIPLVWALRFSGIVVPLFHGFYASVLLILGVNCSLWHTWLLAAVGLGGIAMLCAAHAVSHRLSNMPSFKRDLVSTA